jgi:gamma-glutamylaminecyclotransferase
VLGAGGFSLQPTTARAQIAAADSSSAPCPEPIADFPRIETSAPRAGAFRPAAELRNHRGQPTKLSFATHPAVERVRRDPRFAMRRSMLLFVYGTLRRGQENHSQLADARFVAEVRTEPRFELVDLGGYPGLLEGGETAVSGELYELDAAHLARLDEFEDVPQLYERKLISVEDACAHVYVMPRDRATFAPRIDLGDWCAVALPACS